MHKAFKTNNSRLRTLHVITASMVHCH